MKDQWSGKILRPNSLTMGDSPARVSMKFAIFPVGVEAWYSVVVEVLMSISHAPNMPVQRAHGNRSGRPGSPLH
ncbi:hypothetical protein ACFFX0_04925 [Citricoccus parietis]|uniref:Uncharacterized protein n=1 Tax=Citricoccus parietis TaxID=592307 RepID=A0ABV5FV53_9MICC